jgi:hypothetical protein
MCPRATGYGGPIAAAGYARCYSNGCVCVPGGGPPPPPGMPAMAPAPMKKKQEPKVKLKQVHWVKINERKLKDTIWETMKDEEVDLDKDEIEKLFAMKESGMYVWMDGCNDGCMDGCVADRHVNVTMYRY